jgi:nucleoid-associated protein YgaU
VTAPRPGGRAAATQRIVLRPKSGGDPLRFDYNPTTVSVRGSARWDRPATKGNAPGEYVKMDPRSFSLQARLDARADTKEQVAQKIERLFSWMRPTDASLAKKAPAAPVLAMTWGTQRWFDVVLVGVNATYTVFDPDGRPTRAQVELDLEEHSTTVKRQNPTSGGPPGRRARLLVAGDTLQSVATEEYGDPTRWRVIAAANGIDDPLAVRPGVELLLPSLTDGGAW